MGEAAQSGRAMGHVEELRKGQTLVSCAGPVWGKVSSVRRGSHNIVWRET